jgi:ABC-type Fe3+ transport system substrate-binding protein
MPGDPVLVIISPHNEAIRREFGRAFSDWHARRHGRPVKVDWRNIGGTTEIMRYLAAEYVASFRAWWRSRGREWPPGGGELLLDTRFKPDAPPAEIRADAAALRRWELHRELHQAFRAADDPAAFTCRIDLFFGGGTYDHGKAFAQGLTVAPWPPEHPPPDTIAGPGGEILIPREAGGEVWRTATFFGNALSTFGICYNLDRLAELGLPVPSAWRDLTDPRYFRQLGVADPTKSGSIAKAFEIIIHEQCWRAVRRAGFRDEQVAQYEARIGRAGLPAGELPPDVPAAYQAAVEQGWVEGLRLVQSLGANARYFSDSASKVPLDVSAGDAAAGLAIDFYGRHQSEVSRAPDGEPRLRYVTPAGGSSVSADPISLLRGAEHRELAVRFIAFVLSADGQKLWNYRAGAPGGPARFALRRLPIRRDFYPSDDPGLQAAYERHRAHTSDALGDPAVNPYELAREFTYQSRWTGAHFGVQRDLIRAMCMDAGEELQGAWKAVLNHGGPEQQPAAMALLGRMPDRPEPLTWTSAPGIAKRFEPVDYMREWTLFFRESYRQAEAEAEGQTPEALAEARRTRRGGRRDR